MSTDAAARRACTVDEYLAWEHNAPEKHAFFRGEVFAMAGASEAHNLLVANLVTVLST
ncbi:Uma2 family endonuclease [Chondromyces apiculatus]|uniref:Uncharacterized protein n=1 Tax=Chondromyces apiculatus DSM 436 TaxID=1192034 RepID=A0A017TB28_9BACT|nr:Uma2 family endonuclease [Chondromyces apiculatus]EYF06444.1 Hypothetical protein CAP_1974 [Chondromyces apiculatus DSM 436]